MLTSTFIHTPGVGYSTERRIWARGITTWGEFLARPGAAGLGLRQTMALEAHLIASWEHLDELNHRFFGQFLPSREHWRVYPALAGKTAYLDIETTGLGEENVVTVIGVYDGENMRAFVRDEGAALMNGGKVSVLPFREFGEAIEPFGVLVTFFGSGFDLPFLRREFGDLREGRIHLDLCHLMRRVGYSGGLKRIEQSLGISRSGETAGLGGWDAVRLWNEYRRGSREALELLLHYNREDVENLEVLLRFAIQRLQERCWAEVWGGGAKGLGGNRRQGLG